MVQLVSLVQFNLVWSSIRSNSVSLAYSRLVWSGLVLLDLNEPILIYSDLIWSS